MHTRRRRGPAPRRRDHHDGLRGRAGDGGGGSAVHPDGRHGGRHRQRGHRGRHARAVLPDRRLPARRRRGGGPGRGRVAARETRPRVLSHAELPGGAAADQVPIAPGALRRRARGVQVDARRAGERIGRHADDLRPRASGEGVDARPRGCGGRRRGNPGADPAATGGGGGGATEGDARDGHAGHGGLLPRVGGKV